MSTSRYAAGTQISYHQVNPATYLNEVFLHWTSLNLSTLDTGSQNVGLHTRNTG